MDMLCTAPSLCLHFHYDISCKSSESFSEFTIVNTDATFYNGFVNEETINLCIASVKGAFFVVTYDYRYRKNTIFIATNPCSFQNNYAVPPERTTHC